MQWRNTHIYQRRSLNFIKVLNKGRPTWWHLLYYVNLLLNMFRMLIHPSSADWDYLVRYCVGCIVLTSGVLVLCSGIGCWWCGIRVQAEPLLAVGDVTSECRLNHYWLLVMWYPSAGWTTTGCWWFDIRVQAEPLLAVSDVISECRLNH